MSKGIRTVPIIVLMFAAGFCTDVAVAQVAVEAELRVPVQSVFSVNTSVVVPDRGGTYLGGVRSARTFRNEATGGGRGLEQNRAALDAQARVWIIDLNEQEEGLAARAGPAKQQPEAKGFAAGIRQYASGPAASVAKAKHAPVPNAAAGTISVARRSSAAEADWAGSVDDESVAESRATDLFAHGQVAEARGKLNIAQIYFRSAARLAPAPSAKLAQERLRSLDTKLAGL